MRYCVNPEDDEPIFLLDAPIGKDEDNPYDRYIDGAEFVRELLEVDKMGKDKIWVWINSPGGSVYDGEAIYGTILKTKTKVNTLCYGIAYSMAGVIFQAGRERVMMDYAKLMYHEASGTEGKGLEVINDAITTMISSRSWKDESAVRKMMNQETFINSDNAIASDLCDRVERSDQLNRPRVSKNADAMWKYANEYVNKILPTKTDTMTKVEAIKLLGLKDTATDAEVFAAMNKRITDLDAAEKVAIKAKNDAEAAKVKAEESLKKASNSGKEAEEDEDEEEESEEDKGGKKISNLEKELTELKKQLNEKNKKDEASEKEAKKNAAKARILETVNKRGLKMEQAAVDNYVALATDDATLETTIKAIESIPVINKAPKTPDLSSSFKDETGIPLIPTDGTDEKGHPKAGDTSKVVDAINSFDMKAYNRKKSK